MGNEDIIQLESSNTGKIILLKKGSFYRAYEHSAWLFVREVRDYVPVKTLPKNLRGESLVYIGFNVKTLPQILHGKRLLTPQWSPDKLPDRIEMAAVSSFDEVEFRKWKEDVPLFEKQKPALTPVPPAPPALPVVPKEPLFEDEANQSVVDEIKNFDLLNKTPYECMLFLTSLKAKL